MSATNSDSAYLGQLRDHYARHGALPSYAGISEVVGFRAKTAAVKLAQRLTAAGFLRNAPGGKLAPADRFFELPLADVPVRAGSAETIDGQVGAELVTLDSFLIDSPSTTVLVRVKGDSMIEAGVLDGDLAVVDRAKTAQAGEFIVAVVDGEFTFKQLRIEAGQPFLQPHNAKLSAVHPKSTLEVFGVVRGIVRRYRQSAAQPQRNARGKR